MPPKSIAVARRPAAVAWRRPAGGPPSGPRAGQQALANMPPEQDATGPFQATGTRSGCARRQYCWWLTFSAPYPATVERFGLKSPAEFTRQEFLDVVKAAHAAAGVELEEAAVFLELHARVDDQGNRVPHLNCLVRAGTQYGWRAVGQLLAAQHKIRVDFSANVRNWYGGVVYGTVASEHKPREELDANPLQWAASGIPIPFCEVLPPKWHQGERQPKLSPLQAYDLCTRRQVRNEAEAWVVAKAMEREGQRGLLAFLLEHTNVEGFIGKVVFASQCEEEARRQQSHVQCVLVMNQKRQLEHKQICMYVCIYMLHCCVLGFVCMNVCDVIPCFPFVVVSRS